MHNGVFIVLEGPDGSGTTSQSKLLAERLQKEGHDVLLTAEPTTGPVGVFIRHQLSVSGNSVTAGALQLLFTADRAWHVDTVIEPALKEGKVVVCERYGISTVIYGDATGLDGKWLEAANDKFLKPDLLIVTLPRFELAIERINKRKEKDIMEEKVELQRRIHDLYRAYAAAHPECPLIDTSGTLEESAEQIHRVVSEAISRKKSFSNHLKKIARNLAHSIQNAKTGVAR